MRKRIIAGLLIVYLCFLAFMTFISQKNLSSSVPRVRITTVAGASVNGHFCEKTVPEEAIMRDQTGTFLFGLVEKTTPLGQRFYVMRYPVVVEEADTNAHICAVTVSLAVRSRVAVTTEELKDKAIVMPAEEKR